MAGREVGQPVVPADRLHVVDVAGAAKVAGGRQVDLHTQGNMFSGVVETATFSTVL